MSVPAILLAIGALAWLLYLATVVNAIRKVPVLSDLEPPPPPRWPRVSIVVPARDEAQHLEAALRSKLGQDYPDLEVIAVNDRSTDPTGEILRQLAAQDP